MVLKYRCVQFPEKKLAEYYLTYQSLKVELMMKWDIVLNREADLQIEAMILFKAAPRWQQTEVAVAAFVSGSLPGFFCFGLVY